MKNSEQKEIALWWKLKFLGITKISLNLYKKTNDEKFYQHAEYFAKETKRKDGEYQSILQ